MARIQLAPIDFAIKEPFFILALAPVMVYGTIATIRGIIERGVQK